MGWKENGSLPSLGIAKAPKSLARDEQWTIIGIGFNKSLMIVIRTSGGVIFSASQVAITERSSIDANLLNGLMFDVGICCWWFYFGIDLIYRATFIRPLW